VSTRWDPISRIFGSTVMWICFFSIRPTDGDSVLFLRIEKIDLYLSLSMARHAVTSAMLLYMTNGVMYFGLCFVVRWSQGTKKVPNHKTLTKYIQQIVFNKSIDPKDC
jgi:hypothetical protein